MPWYAGQTALTADTAADCGQAGALIEGIDATELFADKAYDTDAILARCEQQGMAAVIPAKNPRQESRTHDDYLYRHRHRVENAFL